MNKLYNKITFENDNVPALNESNLNSISKAIDDIDDRLIDVAGLIEGSISMSYTDLTDKPSINGVTLEGNKTSANLSVTSTTVADKDHLNVGQGNTINTQGASYYPVGVVGQYNQLSQNAKNSFVSGMSNNVTGDTSIVAGNGNKSSGSYSAVLGLSNEATGSNSVVLGKSNKTTSNCANAIGYGLKNSNMNSIVVGNYNTDKTGVIFAVGNGSSDSSRHNALEVTTANKIILGLPAESEYPIKASSVEDTQGNKLSKVASDVAQLNDDIVDLNSDITTINSSITTINSNLATQSNINNQQSRDIQNLYEMAKGNLYTEQTDDTVARVKTIPSGACTYGTIDLLGGMSRKGKNLLDMTKINTKINNATSISYDDNKITFVTSNTYQGFYGYIDLESGTYTLSVSDTTNGTTQLRLQSEDGTSTITNVNKNSLSSTQSITQSGRYRLTVTCTTNGAGTYVIDKPQLEKTSSVTSYEPYTENLIDVKVDKVVSYGSKNIFSLSMADEWEQGTYATQSNSRIAHILRFNENGTYSLQSTKRGIIQKFVKGTKNWIENIGGWFTSGQATSFNVDTNYDYIIIATQDDNTSSITVEDAPNVMINKGASINAYVEPLYITKTIPQSIKSLDGYGIGINSTCYNYIDFDRKVFVKKVGSVDLGSLDWTFEGGSDARMWTPLANAKYIANVVPNIICHKYDSVNIARTLATYNLDDVISISDNPRIYVRDTSYTDATTFKNAMNGQILYYELATPTETDISSMLDTDADILTVEENGTLSFHYPSLDDGYSVDMPSTENYLIKL